MARPRYRCNACGNLTRFDTETTVKRKAFWHYSVGGELKVEEEMVVSETVDSISCRWCGNGLKVEAIGEELSP